MPNAEVQHLRKMLDRCVSEHAQYLSEEIGTGAVLRDRAEKEEADFTAMARTFMDIDDWSPAVKQTLLLPLFVVAVNRIKELEADTRRTWN